MDLARYEGMSKMMFGHIIVHKNLMVALLMLQVSSSPKSRALVVNMGCTTSKNISMGNVFAIVRV